MFEWLPISRLEDVPPTKRAAMGWVVFAGSSGLTKHNNVNAARYIDEAWYNAVGGIIIPSFYSHFKVLEPLPQ